MKYTCMILSLASLLAFAHCFPGVRRDVSDSDEDSNGGTVLILPGRRDPFFVPDFDPIDDSGFGMPTFGFDRFFQHFRNTVKNIFSRPIESPAFPKIPEGANSTSTTKVINGHVVTVNETTYNSGNNDSNAFFKFTWIDVRPQNATDNEDKVETEGGEVTEVPSIDRTTEASSDREETTRARSVETVEDFGDNEISNPQVETVKNQKLTSV